MVNYIGRRIVEKDGTAERVTEVEWLRSEHEIMRRNTKHANDQHIRLQCDLERTEDERTALGKKCRNLVKSAIAGWSLAAVFLCLYALSELAK